MALKQRKGQTIFYTLMLGIVIVVLALAMTPVVQEFVTDARAPSDDVGVGLDCANTTITNFNKAQCIMTDFGTPYFFLGLLGIAAAVIGARLIIGGMQ